MLTILTAEILYYVFPILFGGIFLFLSLKSTKAPKHSLWNKIFLVLFLVSFLVLAVWQIHTLVTILQTMQEGDGKLSDFILNLVLYTVPTVSAILFGGMLLLKVKHPKNILFGVLSTAALVLLSVSLALTILYHGFVVLVIMGM